MRSRITGKALARHGSRVSVSPSLNLNMWSWQTVVPRSLPWAWPSIMKPHVPQMLAAVVANTIGSLPSSTSRSFGMSIASRPRRWRPRRSGTSRSARERSGRSDARPSVDGDVSLMRSSCAVCGRRESGLLVASLRASRTGKRSRSRPGLVRRSIPRRSSARSCRRRAWPALFRLVLLAEVAAGALLTGERVGGHELCELKRRRRPSRVPGSCTGDAHVLPELVADLADADGAQASRLRTCRPCRASCNRAHGGSCRRCGRLSPRGCGPRTSRSARPPSPPGGRR